MIVHDTLFWFFSIAMLLSGVLVIASRNPVSSALYLVLVFVFMAGLFVLLEAFLLAAIQVLVYAGAVMVLFLFVIMLLDIKASQQRRVRVIALIGGLAVAGALVWELGIILYHPLPAPAAGLADPVYAAGVKPVMRLLFTNYLLPFEVTALVLLVAMIGVVLLSRKETE
ncbi:NADH-quinone oxidoreductase subunit J [bacterium]|nr:NADH-quinone oxidoreductase subunit J [bacterium]